MNNTVIEFHLSKTSGLSGKRTRTARLVDRDANDCAIPPPPSCIHLCLFQLVVAAGWSTAIAINFNVLYGLYSYRHDPNTMDLNLAAFYIGTSRFAWSLGIAWVTVACITGYGGV